MKTISRFINMFNRFIQDVNPEYFIAVFDSGGKSFRNEIYDQKQIIAQYNIDLDEIEFLRLNLKFGHTCRKSFLNNDGFEVGTMGYKSCVMNKGRTND